MKPRPNWDAFPLVSIDGQVQLFSIVVPAPWDQLNVARRTLTLPELDYLAAWRATDDAESAAASSTLTTEEQASLIETLRDFGLITDLENTDLENTNTGNTERTALSIPEVTDGPDGIAGDVILSSPQAWAVEPEGFVCLDHDGKALGAADATDLYLARLFNMPTPASDKWQAAQEDKYLAASLADRADYNTRIGRLLAMGVLASVTDRPELLDRSNVFHNRIREGMIYAASIRKDFDRRISEHQAQLEADGNTGLVPVYGVVPPSPSPPLALGSIFAMAAASDDSRLDRFDLYPRWLTTNSDMSVVKNEPAVFLFSNYLWSHQRNLDFARELKSRNPDAVTIHGGPDCPSYERDTVTYMETHEYVDIAVRGEGEATAIHLLLALGEIFAGNADWSSLSDVPGIAFRNDGQIVRTPDRDRITDLNEVPSPFLDGTFDAFTKVDSIGMAIVETNRGCPYGCTFCDWGSATNSRIRKFDLDRVFAEFEWCAQNKVERVFVADANYGIFARDVDIARHIAELKGKYGYPRRFLTNYAKNTVKHLREIVEILSEAGIVSEGLLSLQSLDETTLDSIRRSNIKLEKYEALAGEFRASKLPLFVDLMMGLPGQTVESLEADLQQCVDRGVQAKCHGTELLVNSPMNDPEYRSEFEIETTRLPGPLAGTATKPSLVVSTTSFTRADYAQMHEMRRFYLLAENHGVLRYVARFVRQAIGMKEVALYERVRTTAAANPRQWPTLALVCAAIPDSLSPPPSWQRYIDEVHKFVVDELGVADDVALAATLAVQHQMLPTPGRAYPATVSLPNDYPAWLQDANEAKDRGDRDNWEDLIPPLSSYGPVEFAVADPRQVSSRNLGHGSALDSYNDWELESSVSRAVAAHYTI